MLAVRPRLSHFTFLGPRLRGLQCKGDRSTSPSAAKRQGFPKPLIQDTRVLDSSGGGGEGSILIYFSW